VAHRRFCEEENVLMLQVKTAIVLLIAMFPAWVLAARGVFASKDLSKVHAGDSRPCMFFTLEACVTENRMKPDASRKKLYVTTTSTPSSCGHAKVEQFILE
jgi:hypothetical protein